MYSVDSDFLLESLCVKSLIIRKIKTIFIKMHVLLIDTTFELHVFWPFDTEIRIKLTFSEPLSLSIQMRLGLLSKFQDRIIFHIPIIDKALELLVFFVTNTDVHIISVTDVHTECLRSSIFSDVRSAELDDEGTT